MYISKKELAELREIAKTATMQNATDDSRRMTNTNLSCRNS